MKIIFLDVDGVLNRMDRWNPELATFGIDPAAMGCLQRLVDESGAHIVLSSTWRLGRSLGDIEKLFQQWGLRAELAGRTGHRRGHPRGVEIADWLHDRAHCSPVPVQSFVILDDDDDMGELADRLVRTNCETGLVDADVTRALKILTGAAGAES